MVSINQVDKNKIAEIVKVLGVEELTAELLVSRGYDTVESAKAFLYPKLEDLPDFTLYSGVKEAIARINQAIECGEKIVVYGDYDCDGVCAVAILSESLKKLGADVSVYIPKRLEDGYGLSIDTLEKVAEEYFPDLIITVDCGISSRKEVDYCLNELGIDVLVTDHHEPPEELPECIVINPHLDEEKGYFADFCGAGVAFMLVNAMTDTKFSANYLDIVAIATMGDIVSLIGANRVLVKYGIKKLLKAPCPGLKQLISSLELSGELTGYDLAFKIVPRINSLGRLGDATRAIALFTETDYFVLSCLIKEMNEENLSRQNLCEKIEKEALEYAKPFLNTERAIILYGQWHKGVLGITASKLAEKFHRPVILFCLDDGVLRGSCRSVKGINIYELLCHFEKYFIQFGGHAQAAGVAMDISKFEEFRSEFLYYVKSNFPTELFREQFAYDIDITSRFISKEFLGELKHFEPFGQKNPKPVFLSKVSSCNFQYNKNNPVHITESTKLGYSVSGFYKGELLPALNSSAEKQCLYSLSLNEFNGRIYSQAVLEKVLIKDLTDEDVIDYEIENYAKTASFSTNCEQVFQKNEFYRIMLDSYLDNLYGNITVCYTKKTYFEVQSYLKSKNIPFELFYGAPTTKNTLNAVVYCPNENFNFDLYDNVFFADKPLLYPECNETFSIDEPCLLFNKLTQFQIDRSVVAEYYVNIKRFITVSRYRNVRNLFNALGLNSEKYLEFLLVWQILKDVGLIAYNEEDKCFIVKNIKTELTKSNLYCIINNNG